MRLLRRVLYWGAAVWAVSGAVFALVPKWLLHGVFDQPNLAEYAWPRMAGILFVGVALLMVLVAHRIEDLWWWSWAFALIGSGIAILCGLNASVGTPSGAPSLFWWLMAGLTGVFTLGLLAGLAKTGTEREVG